MSICAVFWMSSRCLLLLVQGITQTTIWEWTIQVIHIMCYQSCLTYYWHHHLSYCLYAYRHLGHQWRSSTSSYLCQTMVSILLLFEEIFSCHCLTTVKDDRQILPYSRGLWETAKNKKMILAAKTISLHGSDIYHAFFAHVTYHGALGKVPQICQC